MFKRISIRSNVEREGSPSLLDECLEANQYKISYHRPLTRHVDLIGRHNDLPLALCGVAMSGFYLRMLRLIQNLML